MEWKELCLIILSSVVAFFNYKKLSFQMFCREFIKHGDIWCGSWIWVVGLSTEKGLSVCLNYQQPFPLFHLMMPCWKLEVPLLSKLAFWFKEVGLLTKVPGAAFMYITWGSLAWLLEAKIIYIYIYIWSWHGFKPKSCVWWSMDKRLLRQGLIW